jgi:hypothetical protein
LECRSKKEKTNETEDIFLWQQLQQQQRCVNLKNLQRGTEADVACVEDRVAFIEILVFVGYVYANWHTMVKYRDLQNQAGNKITLNFKKGWFNDYRSNFRYVHAYT